MHIMSTNFAKNVGLEKLMSSICDVTNNTH